MSSFAAPASSSASLSHGRRRCTLPLSPPSRRHQKERGERGTSGETWNSGEAAVTMNERMGGFSLFFFRPPWELLRSSFPSANSLLLPASSSACSSACHLRLRAEVYLLPLHFPLRFLRHLRPSERERKRELASHSKILNPCRRAGFSHSLSLSIYLSLTNSGRRCSAVIGSFYAAIFTFLLKATSLCRWVMAKGKRECEHGAPWSPRGERGEEVDEGRDTEDGWGGVARNVDAAGGRVAGMRRVSIQLPRISSGRGDSPPRICHLRGRDCPRIPARFSKYYDNIYPRTPLRDRPIRGEEKKRWKGGFVYIGTPNEFPVISRYAICFKVSRRVNAMISNLHVSM